MSDENIVFVGTKPASSYVLAVTSQFEEGSSMVVIKARGKAISKAVDVAEIVRRRYVKDAEVADITIGTEEVTSEDGRTLRVSSMSIVLARQDDRT
ncbi:RNA-binding protein [Methanomassiliicoccales archaeon RumEn M1]|nr:RNA-binding protein [Methanomassiliicoccales archaeon RumEn M1]